MSAGRPAPKPRSDVADTTASPSTLRPSPQALEHPGIRLRPLATWPASAPARRVRGEGAEAFTEDQFATQERLAFSPLPCWAHLPEKEQRRQVADLIAEIEEEGERERQQTGKSSLGVEKILNADPHHRPDKVKKSPKPRFHALAPEVFELLWQAWSEVIAAFREASARLLSGERDVEFPEGTFPPHLPFIPFAETLTIQARGQPV